MYSAESIITALKSNSEISCEGLDAIYCPSLHTGCGGDPDNCELCLQQKCIQRVSVHHNYKKLIVLNFRFMVSKQNHGGFIPRDNSELETIIKRKFIDRNMLQPVKGTSV